jgi:hypothetical protein
MNKLNINKIENINQQINIKRNRPKKLQQKEDLINHTMMQYGIGMMFL